MRDVIRAAYRGVWESDLRGGAEATFRKELPRHSRRDASRTSHHRHHISQTQVVCLTTGPESIHRQHGN
jgi:hypothetical protein